MRNICQVAPLPQLRLLGIHPRPDTKQPQQNTVLTISDLSLILSCYICCSWLPRLRCHPEVTSDQTKSNAHGVFPDQNYRVWDLVPAHNSMVRGHFGLGMVWSEVTSVWGWYDQRSLRSGDGMIRDHFGLGMVWSEVTSGWEWSDQRRIQAHISLIRDHFQRIFLFLFFLNRDAGSVKRQQKAAFWLLTYLESDVFNQNYRGSTDWKCQSPDKKVCLTVKYDVLFGKLSKFIHWVGNMH